MSLIEDRQGAEAALAAHSGAPSFLPAGAAATGEFRCAECGYGIAVRSLLPICPMCRGLVWDDPATSPYGRSRL